MEYYDLIVIGAGPAGLSFTKELSNSQLKILLLDRKKSVEDVRYYSSGSFIDPGEWNIKEGLYHTIDTFRISSKNTTVIKKGKALILNRKKLLEYFELESRKNENLVIKYRANVKNVILNNGVIKGITYSIGQDSFEAQGKIFIDCSGPSSLLLKKTGINPSGVEFALGVEYLVPLNDEPYTIDLFVGSHLKGGYGWIFPINEKAAIVGFGTLLREYFPSVQDTLEGLWQYEVVSKRCELNPMEKNFAILKTGPPTKTLTNNNLLFIGDAILQANPLIGEGLRFIMEAARIAAHWTFRSIESNDFNLLKGYEREWYRRYYKKYKKGFKFRQNFMKASHNDRYMDRGLKMLNSLSSRVFMQLLRGDISFVLFLKMVLSLIKRFFSTKGR